MLKGCRIKCERLCYGFVRKQKMKAIYSNVGIERNVRRLIKRVDFAIIVASKLVNGLQTPQDMDMKRMLERCRSLCLWI
jgi:hypothetical protein